ncbi:MAG: hypothetical protein ACT4P1_03015 [Sporichthyaceae bacterium]
MTLAAFPGAIPVEEYVKRTYDAALAYGLVSEKTLAMVGVCRDELSDAFTEPVRAAWGPPFRMSGLAGMLFLGQAGLRAAQQHAPGADGRRRYVAYVLPHIGIGDDGTPGFVHRPGQDVTTTACGALMAFRDELVSGRVNGDLDPDDLELSLLRQRLLRAIPYGEVPDIIELTRIVRDAMLDDLGRTAARMGTWGEGTDLAVFSGIHIHTSDGDYVEPAHSAIRLSDGTADIPLTL